MSEKDERHPIKMTDRRRVGPHLQAEAGSRGDEVAEGSAPDDGPGLSDPGDRDEGIGGPDLTSGAVAEARREAAEYLEQLQRVTADFDNARKRMVKDQTRVMEMASERLVAQLLDVLDEFQIAMVHGEQAPPEFGPYLKGFELVYAKLFDTLRAEGLERIDAVGTPFDPTRHEALMQTGEGDGHPVVTEVLRDGYTFKGKVLRPAGVKVHREQD